MDSPQICAAQLEGEIGTTLSTTLLILQMGRLSHLEKPGLPMYFMKPSPLLHKVMPCTSPILPGPGSDPDFDLTQESHVSKWQTHVNCGPLSPNILQGVWPIRQQGS